MGIRNLMDSWVEFWLGGWEENTSIYGTGEELYVGVIWLLVWWLFKYFWYMERVMARLGVVGRRLGGWWLGYLVV